MSRAGPSIYLLALEPSGDVLGAKLMRALKQETASSVSLSGVGGSAMQTEGLESLFDPSELAILGLIEVLPKAGLVVRRVRDVLADIEQKAPDLLVTVDSWGFTGRVHKALAKRNSTIKRVRYVAPQVWAWRPGRAQQLAGWIDHLLTLLPFEPPLFERHGLHATWVGHPIVEETALGNKDRFVADHAVPAHSTVITALPGSRWAEVRALTPVFGQTLAGLSQRYPNLRAAIPTVPGVAGEVRAWANVLPVDTHVIEGEEAKKDAFAASTVALAASGTVTLELALARVPHVIAYKVNPLSAFVFKRLAKTKYVNLINVLQQQEVVPECLQDRCTADVLMNSMADLIDNEPVRTRQRTAFRSVVEALTPGDVYPSRKAAQVILNLLD